MVANVLGGGADAGEIAKVIRARQPDLVSLPEARARVCRRPWEPACRTYEIEGTDHRVAVATVAVPKS